MNVDSSDYDPFEDITPLFWAGEISYEDDETLLHRAVGNENHERVQILLENGTNPNLTNELGKTPLHYAVVSKNQKIVRVLLENGANPNLVDEHGLTPLHYICKKYNYYYEDLEIFFKINEDHNQTVDVNVRDKLGKTPLHYALFWTCKIQDIVRVLLENGANPNLTDEKELTPLHYICKKYNFYYEDLEIFFKINEDYNQTVDVNVRDKKGNTPLHLALGCVDISCKKAVEVLLRSGANPNSANAEGSTPLHLICKKRYFHDNEDEDLAELFFKINDERHQTVQVDAIDKLGNTPLHLALECVDISSEKVVELLLRRGADPNVANADGSTPLHLICDQQYYFYDYIDDLLELFFKINDERHQTVAVNALDNSGRTPLQLAVVYVLPPHSVHAILNHGADLSNFLFTTEPFETRTRLSVTVKFKVIFGFLAIMDHLENGGYEITFNHALKIMNIFHVYGFLKNSTNLEEYWNDKEQMAIETKEIMINSSLSLYDLIQLRPKEAAKLLTYTDCYKFMNTVEISELPEEPRKACVLHLCEKLSRGFFRCWALECFMELTHCRLPLECCELIIDESFTNEKLRNICLATAKVQSS